TATRPAWRGPTRAAAASAARTTRSSAPTSASPASLPRSPARRAAASRPSDGSGPCQVGADLGGEIEEDADEDEDRRAAGNDRQPEKADQKVRQQHHDDQVGRTDRGGARDHAVEMRRGRLAGGDARKSAAAGREARRHLLGIADGGGIEQGEEG